MNPSCGPNDSFGEAHVDIFCRFSTGKHADVARESLRDAAAESLRFAEAADSFRDGNELPRAEPDGAELPLELRDRLLKKEDPCTLNCLICLSIK